MAEALIRHRLGPAAAYRVGSAGLAALDGGQASAPAREVMRELGLDLSAHRSRMLRPGLVRDAAAIFAMTAAHRRNILSLYPDAEKKVFLMKSLDPARPAGDIEDPAGSSTEMYRRTRDEIDEALLDIILFLKRRFNMDAQKTPGERK